MNASLGKGPGTINTNGNTSTIAIGSFNGTVETSDPHQTNHLSLDTEPDNMDIYELYNLPHYIRTTASKSAELETYGELGPNSIAAETLAVESQRITNPFITASTSADHIYPMGTSASLDSVALAKRAKSADSISRSRIAGVSFTQAASRPADFGGLMVSGNGNNNAADSPLAKAHAILDTTQLQPVR